jgi:hypothetical protein
MALSESQVADLQKKAKSSVTATLRIEADVDHTLVDEILLYSDNDRDLYGSKLALVKNLRGLLRRNKYDAEQAVRLWRNYVTQAEKKYTQEFGDILMSPADRNAAAKELEMREKELIENGEYDYVSAAFHEALVKATDSPEIYREEVLKDLVAWAQKNLKLDLEVAQQEVDSSLHLFAPQREKQKGRYESFSTRGGTVVVEGTEYNFFDSEDEAERVAVEIVEEQLRSEPELFSQDWLQNYYEVSPTDARLIAQEDAEAAELGDEEEEEKYAEEVEKRLLSDPLGYLKELGYDENSFKDLSWVRLDVANAAKDAVATDGWAHFLSHYDSDYDLTPAGRVIFRED